MHLASGVYFRREDYAPFWRRVLVLAIDLTVFVTVSLLTALPLTFLPVSMAATFNLMLLNTVEVAFFYFVVLKRSKFRTLGYRVARVRIVSPNGEAPDYPSMFLRLMFGTLVPFHWLNWIWLTNDSHRQTLHDKVANTYVVKANAQAVGKGRIVLRYYEISGYNYLFREIDPGATK